MIKIFDKATGTIKEVVAEILGDSALQEEGKRQSEKAKVDNDRSAQKPNNLNDLT
jgi:uncharacterized protein YjbJ (UPF0337 family)